MARSGGVVAWWHLVGGRQCMLDGWVVGRPATPLVAWTALLASGLVVGGCWAVAMPTPTLVTPYHSATPPAEQGSGARGAGVRGRPGPLCVRLRRWHARCDSCVTHVHEDRHHAARVDPPGWGRPPASPRPQGGGGNEGLAPSSCAEPCGCVLWCWWWWCMCTAPSCPCRWAGWWLDWATCCSAALQLYLQGCG